MDKTISLAILAGGIILVIFGISAWNSFSSDLSRFFTDKPTDKALWMLIAGVVATAVGALGLLGGSRRT